MPAAALEVLVAEAEVRAAAALAAAGLPADLTRAPRPDELASRTSYLAIDNAVTHATREVLQHAEAARSATLSALAGQLRTAGSVADVLAILDRYAAGAAVLPTAEATLTYYGDRIRALLHVLALSSLAQAQADAAAAGIAVSQAGLSTASAAQLATQSLRVAAEAVDAGLRSVRGAAYSTGRTGVPVGEFVDAVMSTAAGAGTTRAVSDTAAQAALRANGAGRTDALAAVASPVRYYASELLDRNTCGPCDNIDGTTYPTYEAMLADYPLGQYVDCLGGSRCRGTAVVVAEQEQPAMLPYPYALPVQPAGPAPALV